MASAKFQIVRKCKVCGESFVAKTIESWYCSSKCSKKAYKIRKAQENEVKKLDIIADGISDSRQFITVLEAHALFGLSRGTIYRLIRIGAINSMNYGERKIRVNKQDLMKLYPLRKKLNEAPEPLVKTYSMEPKDCYTIGEVSKKYHLDDSTVYLHIRKYSIPTRQIGNYVYVPKKEIDNLYKGMKI